MLKQMVGLSCILMSFTAHASPVQKCQNLLVGAYKDYASIHASIEREEAKGTFTKEGAAILKSMQATSLSGVRVACVSLVGEESAAAIEEKVRNQLGY